MSGVPFHWARPGEPAVRLGFGSSGPHFELLTLREVARRLEVKVDTVRVLILRRQIPQRSPSLLRVHARDLDLFLRRKGKEGPGAPPSAPG